MSILSGNIRYLRAQKKLSQQGVADDLEITRGRYGKYEDDSSEPPLDILKKIARYYFVSIDLLLSVDLRKIPLGDLMKLEDNRILLPIMVDSNGEDYIEIIPHKARAGYLTGYSDPEFIESLQRISLPFLRNGKFRAFPLEGDSMPPFKDGSFIVGQYVERLNDIKEGSTYIILTKSGGMVYKRIRRNGNEFVFHSDNTIYTPYEVEKTEILEVWKFACGLSLEEFEPDDMNPDTLKDMIMGLRKDIHDAKKKIV